MTGGAVAPWPMRRELRIRVLFESSRLGDEYLQRTYEFLLPITRRCVQKDAESNTLVDGNSETPERGEPANMSRIAQKTPSRTMIREN